MTSGPKARPGTERPEPRPIPDAERHNAGRPVVAVLEAARDDADDAGMPALARRENEPAHRRALDRCHRLCQHLRLDRAALGVERVEMRGKLARLDRIVGRQEPRAEIGLADAATGIDTRAQDEPRMVSIELLADPGRVAQRGETDIAAPAHHLEPLRHQRAVDAGERHDIANRAERHEIEPLHQIGLLPALIPARLAQRAIDASDEEKGHAHRGQHAMRAFLVEPVGIDHRERARQRGIAQMMIDDDDIESRIAGNAERRLRGDAAIDGDDDARALLFQLQQRGRVGPITFALAIGDIDGRLAVDGLKKAPQQRR